MRLTSNGLTRAFVLVATTGAIAGVYIAGLVLHAYLRGAADDVRGVTYSPAGIEQALFHGVPSLWLQHWLPESGIAKWLAVFIHASWFYGPIVLALLVLARCGRLSVAHLLALHLTVLFTADLAYIAFPTRPPWMDFELTRVVNLVYGNATEVDANPVAAFPSLHIAVPVLYALWFARQRDPVLRRLAPLLAAWAVAVAWSVVYGGEHYLVDALAGAAWAVAVYAAFEGTLRLAQAAARSLAGRGSSTVVSPVEPAGVATAASRR
jgi:membrane-associated phospholipid phosphatase